MVAVASMIIVTKVFTAMGIASAFVFIPAVVGVKSRNKYCECSDKSQ